MGKTISSLEPGPRAARRLARPSVALSALLIGACQPVSDQGAQEGTGFGTPQQGGSSGVGGAIGMAGRVDKRGPATGGGIFIAPCVPEATSEPPVFSSHVVSNDLPPQKVLYSWTTPEQVAELRRDRQLFIRSEQAGMGRGYAFDVIARLASSAQETEAVLLAKRLSTDLFPQIRYAWPHPWATRMGWPGEDYGNQLLRIVLKEEAWTVRVAQGLISVFEASGRNVPLSMALATPERIGAIFFVKDGASGGVSCGSGTFTASAGGATYREFILGNEAMIEEWSLGTEDILQELGADITALSVFLSRLRSCAPVVDSLELSVACEWANLPHFEPEVSNYLQALSMVSEYYVPKSAQIARIVDTLEADLFTPDPLLVIPGE